MANTIEKNHDVDREVTEALGHLEVAGQLIKSTFSEEA